VWDALAAGVILADGWIDFAPEAIAVDPVRFGSTALEIRGAVRVRAAHRDGRPTAARTPFPAAGPTRVRLSGGGLEIAVRSNYAPSVVRPHVQAALDSAFAGVVRVGGTTLRSRADGVDLEIAFDGAAVGPLTVTAAVGYENHPPAVVVRAPEWTDASRRALAQADPAVRQRCEAIPSIVARAARIDLATRLGASTRDLGANLNRRVGDGLQLQGGLHDRRLLGIGAAGDSLSVAIVLNGPALVRPLTPNP
jgi:hypothetical protein